MANISQNQRGRYNNLSEEKLEAELNKVNPDVKVIYTAMLYQCTTSLVFHSLKENKIVLLTILNPVYWLTVETIKKVCGDVGQIDKIVMFERGSVVHALVQYQDLEAAIEARASLHGCNIFRDSCTIKVEFAKQKDLNVKSNDTRTWDFTLDNNNITKVNGHGKVASLSSLHLSIPPVLSRPAEKSC